MTVPMSPPARIAMIDVARGGAIAAMILYHICWDLNFYGLARFDLLGDTLWLVLRDAILGTFLVLVGVGLSMATRNGIHWPRVTSRVLVIAGGALAVSLASWWFSPERMITFGVLHHIALASVVGLAFLGVPTWAVMVAAVACLGAPTLLAGPTFDRDWLQWLGLMSYTPQTNDYVPLLPWFGPVLAGIALGRGLDAVPRLTGWQPAATPILALGWAGRHSLAIYLTHQPLLIGALWLGLAVFGAMTPGVAPIPVPGPAAPPGAAVRFQGECRTACEKAGASANQCQAYCRCVDAGLAENGLWLPFLNDRLDAASQRRVMGIVQTCATRRVDP